MTKAVMCILLLAAVGQAGTVRAQGQAESIVLGGTRLTLGMPQDTVIAQLAEDYRVQKLDLQMKYPSWYVFENREPYRRVATVDFDEGKLHSVSKHRGPDDEARGYEFAAALYDAVSGLVKEGQQQCYVGLLSKHGREMGVDMFSIACGGLKYLTISVTRVSGYRLAKIEEILTVPEYADP